MPSQYVNLMPKGQELGCQRGPRSEQKYQRRPDQAASFAHKIETLRDSASLACRIRFPTGTRAWPPRLCSAKRKGFLPRLNVLTGLAHLLVSHHRRNAIGDAAFLHDAAHVVLHRLFTEAQLLGDHLVGRTILDFEQYLHFAMTKSDVDPSRLLILSGGEQLGCEFRGDEGRFVLVNRPYRRPQFAGAYPLQNVAVGAGIQSRDAGSRIVTGGKNYAVDLRKLNQYFVEGFQSSSWNTQIQNHDLWTMDLGYF